MQPKPPPPPPPPRHDKHAGGSKQQQHMHADPTARPRPRPRPGPQQPSPSSPSPSSSSSAPSSRLLFVEVRGPRNRRQPGLLYDRSASELKSHVMLVHNKEKRRAEEEEEDGRRRRDRTRLDRMKPVAVVGSGGGGNGLLVRRGGGLSLGAAAAAAIVASEGDIPAYARLTPEMGAQFDDPFDTLPVESTPEVHAAIRHYFENYPGPTPFTHDSLVYDQNAYRREKLEWSQVQFSFCQDQKISYLIMLFIRQVMKNLGKDMNYDTSKYWAVVLQVTREEMPIGKTGTDIPESYVAMIGGLGVAETWLGNFANARQHHSAMLQLVAARGGFATFGAMARRALKWCEFYPCACLALPPRLPRLPVRPLHPDVAAAAAAAHARTMALLPPPLAATELSAILYRLHVCLGRWESPAPSFTGVLDDLEHQILVELAERREASAVVEPVDVDPVDVVHEAVLQAAQMCLFGSMPFTRKEAPMYAAFVASLRRILAGAVAPDDDDGDVVAAWVAVASAESLLWVLFVGWATASQLNGDAAGAVEDARWFIRRFAATLEVLEVGNEEGARAVMEAFPWDHGTYRGLLAALWDIYRHRDELNIT